MSYFTEYLRFSLQIFRMNDVSCHDTTDDSISVKKSLFDISKSNESKNPRIIIFSELFQTFTIEIPEKPIFNISLRDVTLATGFSRSD